MGDVAGHVIVMDVNTVLTRLKTAAWPTQTRIGVCSLSDVGVWHLLVSWRFLELPRQEGTLAKRIAMEQGPSDVTFSSVSESPHSS